MIQKVDIRQLAAEIKDSYFNTSLSHLNDHVVKMSVMTSPYGWHFHPNSDETFIGIEGVVVIETKEETIELSPGELVTIPQNTMHRTMPKGDRSVNITIERADMKTMYVQQD